MKFSKWVERIFVVWFVVMEGGLLLWKGVCCLGWVCCLGGGVFVVWGGGGVCCLGGGVCCLGGGGLFEGRLVAWEMLNG